MVSAHLSEGKIDAIRAGQRMLPVLEGRDAAIDEACGTAPHHDVTAFETQAAHWIGAAFSAHKNTAGKSSETDTIGAPYGPEIGSCFK
jgi:hypothetical protein